VPTHPHVLPQLADEVALTDGGIETTLIFDDGFDLPEFAAFVLLDDRAGRAALERYFAAYLAVADRDGRAIVLETPTWRANAACGDKLGYDRDRLAAVNRDAVALLEGFRVGRGPDQRPVVVSGCIGPRGDGYDPGEPMAVDAARRYHREQIETFADTGADLVTAITMTSTAEATGVALAAQALDVPAVISFTVETDGSLPTGETLRDAVETVEDRTGGSPAYYMINCAHPTHFAGVLEAGAPWTTRIRGIRANASKRSHDELDEAADLDAGDPGELAGEYAELRRQHPHLTVLGGCCGTSDRHIAAISEACGPGR
jgi:homocysteine S-methyltransferase